MRNGFYDWGIFKSSRFSIPIINVGNLSVGGTGKTPHTEYLIRLLSDERNIFTLSRGFGRKERGFIIADKNATARQIGDEPLQYYQKYGRQIGVAVEANRVTGVMDICRLHPETDLILLDDAYQHRAIYSGLNILITDYKHPFYHDFMLPVGNLREQRNGKKRADIIIVSKCPAFNELDKTVIISKIKPLEKQHVFFSRIKYSGVYRLQMPADLIEVKNRTIILVTGIANARPLAQFLEKENTILHHFDFNDHYTFKPNDINEIHIIFNKFAGENPVIITTEKDAMRLRDLPEELELKSYPWFVQSIEVELDKPNEFKQIVHDYVEKNS